MLPLATLSVRSPLHRARTHRRRGRGCQTRPVILLVSERSVSELELRMRMVCYAAHDEQSASRPQPDQRCDASARSSGCSRTCCSAEQLKAHHDESARASRQQQSVRSSPTVRSFALKHMDSLNSCSSAPDREIELVRARSAGASDAHLECPRRDSNAFVAGSRRCHEEL